MNFPKGDAVGEDAGVSDKKSPVERAINLFVYAPVGLLTLAREELPNIIEKGRQELTNQATVAKMMGEYAVNEGRKEAGRRLEQAGETMNSLRAVTDRLDGRGAPAASTTAASPAPAPAAPPAPAPAPVVTPPPAPGAPTPPPAPAPPVDGLAIPGYDALSASQVVQRLAGLSGSELEDVRAYEAATRGRKTILHRVEQLRAGTSS
jgi:hypothetical protein